MPAYVLPELPYDYSALEPHISGKIMELHHAKHHAAYVKGANTALEHLAAARDDGDMSKVNQYAKDLAFNLAGHFNHSIFWKNLSPTGGGEPSGELAAALADSFGSFDVFRGQFGATAIATQGSGWAVLAFEPTARSLMILQLHDQQHNLPAGAIPLLMLDMWEHAYYLDYHNDKAAYVRTFWDVINWDDVSTRLARAKKCSECLAAS